MARENQTSCSFLVVVPSAVVEGRRAELCLHHMNVDPGEAESDASDRHDAREHEQHQEAIKEQCPHHIIGNNVGG